MQAMFIILLVLFSIGIGFFLGVLILSMNTPLQSVLGLGGEESSVDEKQSSPGPDPENKEEGDRQKPSPDAQLLLQIWQIDEDTLLYGYRGKYVAKGDLPENILALLTPAEEAPPPEPEPGKEVEDKPIQDMISPDDSDETEVKPLSLISEIDEILQEKLSDSPLGDKGIKLTENHKKEITIWVGLKSYPAIEDVPDPEIQKIIKESVADWEEQKQ